MAETIDYSGGTYDMIEDAIQSLDASSYPYLLLTIRADGEIRSTMRLTPNSLACMERINGNGELAAALAKQFDLCRKDLNNDES